MAIVNRFDSGPYREDFIVMFYVLPLVRGIHRIPQSAWNAAVWKYIRRNWPDQVEDFIDDFSVDRNGRVIYFPRNQEDAGVDINYLGQVDLLELFGYMTRAQWPKTQGQTVGRLLRWAGVDPETKAEIEEFFDVPGRVVIDDLPDL